MSNVIADMIIKLGVDDSEVEGGISKALGKAGKIAGAAVGAASAAITGVVKESVAAYGEYQQLTGGIETLFKDSSDKMMEYASNAYQTAGISANEYMDTAISISGAILKSADSTAEGAELTQRAISDMADQANKYGRSVQDISATYTSIARGNFQTLDNLFGGMFAGTKTGMEELLAYAEDYRARQGEIVDYSIDSYADIVNAIHDVSEDIGVFGTTMDEAGGTITGSAGSAKAAWENLKVGLADNSADIDGLIKNLVDSVSVMIENIAPIVEQALSGVGTLIEKIAPIIAEKLPGLVEDLLPKLLNAATSLIDGVLKALPSLMTTVIKQIPTIIKGIIKALISAAPQIWKAGAELLQSLADGMGSGDDDILDLIMELINTLVDTILENLPQLINAGLTIVENLVMGIMQKLPDLITAAADIIVTIIEGIVDMLPEILQKGKDVILNIVRGIVDNLPKIIDAIIQVINTLLTTITENLPEILQAGIDVLLELVSGLLEAIPDLIAAIPEIITALVDGLLSLDNLGKLLDAGVQLIGEMVEGLLKFILDAPEKAGKIVGALVGGLIDCIGDMLSAGKKLMNKFWEGLKSVADDIYDWAADTGANIIDALTGGNIKKKQAANQEMFDSLKDETGQIRAGTDELRAKYSNTSSGTSGMYDPSDRYKHYAKAMDTAYLLEGATIFGMMNGSYLEGGERGQEMVVGTEYLASMIQEALEKSNNNQDQKIIIPIYLGQRKIDEVVVDAITRSNYITGGR